MKKKSRVTTTKWNLFFGYSSVVYAIVSGVIIVPLYIKYIPIEVYGAWLASGNILFWLSAVDLGLTTVIIQRVGSAYGRGDLVKSGNYISVGIILCICLSLLILIIGYIITPAVSSFLGLELKNQQNEIEVAFMIAVVGTSLSVAGFGVSAANQGLQGSFGVGVSIAIPQLVSLVVIVTAVIQGFGVVGIAVGVLIRGGGALIGNLVYLKFRLGSENIRLNPTYSTFVDSARMLGYSAFKKIGASAADHIDALLIAKYINTESVAAYVLTKRGPETARMVLLRPGNALIPTVAHLWGEGNVEKASLLLFKLNCYILWGAGLALAGFLALNEQFITIWVGHALYGGNGLNLVLVFTLYVSAPLYFMGLICNAMGDIKNMSLIHFARAVVFVSLAVWGVQKFGVIGIAFAALISTFLVPLMYIPRAFSFLLKMKVSLKIQYFKEVLAVSLVGLSVGLLGPIIKHDSLMIFLSNCFLSATLFGLLLCLISRNFWHEAKRLTLGCCRVMIRR